MTITTPGALIWNLAGYLQNASAELKAQIQLGGLVSITTTCPLTATARDFIRGTFTMRSLIAQTVSFPCWFETGQVRSGVLRSGSEAAYVVQSFDTQLFETEDSFACTIGGVNNTPIDERSTAVLITITRSMEGYPPVELTSAQLASSVVFSSGTAPSGVICGVVPEENWAVSIALGVGGLSKTVLI